MIINERIHMKCLVSLAHSIYSINDIYDTDEYFPPK